MTREELKDFLVEKAEYSQEQVDGMDSYSLLDAMLQWEGIINYTRTIKSWVEAAYGVKLDKKLDTTIL